MNNKDLMIVDGVKLEIGKFYFVKYIHCEGSKWEKIQITRVTVNGHPWQVGRNSDGIITDGSYLVKELTSETELEDYARNWLSENLKNNVDISLVDLFVKMYNDFKI